MEAVAGALQVKSHFLDAPSFFYVPLGWKRRMGRTFCSAGAGAEGDVEVAASLLNVRK